MKRALCLLVTALLVFMASCHSLPAYMADTDVRWGEPAALSTVPPLPTPTPLPPPVTGDVTGVELTLSFIFGERTGSYTGSLKNGLPDGYGRFSSASPQGINWSYKGNWKNGHFNGQGLCFWEDGFMEKGEYLNDQLHGEGRIEMNNILRYEGGFSEGCYDGNGALYDLRGKLIYNGTFHSGYIEEDAVSREERIGEYKLLCTALSYHSLEISGQNGTGMNVQVPGVVIVLFDPVPEAPGYTSFLMTDPKVPDNIVCVTYLLSVGEEPPSVGQGVEVWGSAESQYTYVTQLNTPVSVPLVEARSIETDASSGGFEA